MSIPRSFSFILYLHQPTLYIPSILRRTSSPLAVCRNRDEQT
jgi:hypothetical protein